MELTTAICKEAQLSVNMPWDVDERCLLEVNGSGLESVEQQMGKRMYWGIGYGSQKMQSKRKLQVLLIMDHRDWEDYCEWEVSEF